MNAPERMVIDGALDEASWQEADVGADFYQREPRTGFPASEATEFRLLYDDDYISRTLTSNVRLIHHPLSDCFIVYNESRGISGNSDLNRALSVKFTHLFSF